MFFKRFIKSNANRDAYEIADKSAQYILFFNFLLFLLKAFVGWLGHSFALFADGINNLTDVGASLGLIFALRLASRPPDAEHAYGHGRIETEVARILGIVVLATAGGIIVGGIQKISTEQEQPTLIVTIIAIISILVKQQMYKFQCQVARKLNSRALQADALNHKTDVAATACVLLGTVIVQLAGQKYAYADDVAAIIVGVIMGYAAARIVLSTTQDMLDAMPPREMLDEIKRIVKSVPGIKDTEKILGRKIGMYYFMDIHIEVDPDCKVRDAHYLGHQAVELLKEKIPEIGHVLVHIEPYRKNDRN